MAAMLMTILSVSTVFAAASDGFQLEKDKCSPTDGYKKVEATNVMMYPLRKLRRQTRICSSLLTVTAKR